MSIFPPRHIHKDWILRELKRLNPKSVLDVACAGGAGLWYYSTNLQNVKYTGTDVEVENVSRVELFKKVGIRLKKDDIRDLSFGDNEFDLVLCDSVFNCLNQEDAEKAAKEVQRVARKYVLLLEHHSVTQAYTPAEKIHNFMKLFPGVEFIRNAKGYGDPRWEEYGKLMIWTKPEIVL